MADLGAMDMEVHSRRPVIFITLTLIYDIGKSMISTIDLSIPFTSSLLYPLCNLLY
jgi:hypothetical protein